MNMISFLRFFHFSAMGSGSLCVTMNQYVIHSEHICDLTTSINYIFFSGLVLNVSIDPLECCWLESRFLTFKFSGFWTLY